MMTGQSRGILQTERDIGYANGYSNGRRDISEEIDEQAYERALADLACDIPSRFRWFSIGVVSTIVVGVILAGLFN